MKAQALINAQNAVMLQEEKVLPVKNYLYLRHFHICVCSFHDSLSMH